MKYHKIRNVDKSVCTAEQKIAYNAAFYHTFNYRETWKKTKDNYSRIAQKDFIWEAVHWCMKMIMNDAEICKKYDIDAIQAALNAGMENYFNGCSILSSYEEIGKTFPALYLNQY